MSSSMHPAARRQRPEILLVIWTFFAVVAAVNAVAVASAVSMIVLAGAAWRNNDQALRRRPIRQP